MTRPVISADRFETDQCIENVVNRLKRHCRIGKVTARPVVKAQEAWRDALRRPVPHDDLQRRFG